jgi:hypothetical protein
MAPISFDNSMVDKAVTARISLDIDMTLVLAQISLNNSVVAGGFFTIALNFMTGIDDFSWHSLRRLHHAPPSLHLHAHQSYLFQLHHRYRLRPEAGCVPDKNNAAK